MRDFGHKISIISKKIPRPWVAKVAYFFMSGLTLVHTEGIQSSEFWYIQRFSFFQDQQFYLSDQQLCLSDQ